MLAFIWKQKLLQRIVVQVESLFKLNDVDYENRKTNCKGFILDDSYSVNYSLDYFWAFYILLR